MAFGKEKDINLEIAKLTKQLNQLEAQFTVHIRKERNFVKSCRSASAKKAGEERLRNAYVSLRLVHIAQERLYDISSTNELHNSINDLSKAMGSLNRLDGKDHKKIPEMFLNWRTNKMLKNHEMTEDGGTKQYFDESIEELLIGNEAMDKLVNSDKPLAIILKDDEETLDNLDEYNDFMNDDASKSLYTTDTDDLDDLINSLRG